MLRLQLKTLQRSFVGSTSLYSATAVAAAAAATAGSPPGGVSAATVGASLAATPEITDFVRHASNLKKRFRGKGRYAYARQAAQRFLDAEVPKTNVNEWMEYSSNALALAQLLSFFEVQPDSSLASILLNRLLRTAEDANMAPAFRLRAALMLLTLRPEENYERALTVVEEVLKSNAFALGSSLQEKMATWDVCAKVLQRCGQRVPPSLSTKLAEVVMRQIAEIPVDELRTVRTSLLRVFSWMVRADRPESDEMLRVLVDHTGNYSCADFATLMMGCGRLHQVRLLPAALILRLATESLRYSSSASGGDAASILGAMAHVVSSLEPECSPQQQQQQREQYTQEQVAAIRNRWYALLEDYQPCVLRFMDAKDRIFWSRPADVTNIVFAYELGGHVHFANIFTTYRTYVSDELPRLEPPELALAAGILRRAQLLDKAMSQDLGERVEMSLGEFRLRELSHICATFATLPSVPTWMEEAKEVALRHTAAAGVSGAEVPASVWLQLSIAFPDESRFAGQIDYSNVSPRQLVDALPMVARLPQFRGPIVAALVARLNAISANVMTTSSQAAAPPLEYFSADELRVLLAAGESSLVAAVNSYILRCFYQPQWSIDTLYYMPLVASADGGPARDSQKALAAAKTASVSPELFVSLSELLLSVFGTRDGGINTFVQQGGIDLQRGLGVSFRTLVRYLAVVSTHQAAHPTEKWLHNLTDSVSCGWRKLDSAQVESMLLSCHNIYGSAGRTPALQPLLTLVMERYYQTLTEPTVEAARITVLLVHLQQGMSLPLLTRNTEMVARVLRCSQNYPQGVRDALAVMPLPTNTASAAGGAQTLGRFTLKPRVHQSTRDEAEEIDALYDPHTLDFNTEDPFSTAPMEAEAEEKQGDADALGSNASVAPAAAKPPAATKLEVETPPPPPQRQQQPPSDGDSASTAVETPAQHQSRQQEETTLPEPDAPTQAASAHHSSGESSYYTKFFNSSVGQIFKFRYEENEQQQQQSHAMSAEELQPRRTALRARGTSGDANAEEQSGPTGHHPEAEAPRSPNAPATDSMHQQQQQVISESPEPPSATEIKTEWSSRNPFAQVTTHASQQQQQQQQQLGFWGAPPTAASTPFPAEPAPVYRAPSVDNNAKLFSNIFDKQPQSQHQQQDQSLQGQKASTPFGTTFSSSFASAAAPRQGQQQQYHHQHHSTAFGSMLGVSSEPAQSSFMGLQQQQQSNQEEAATGSVRAAQQQSPLRRAGLSGGNNVFYDPSGTGSGGGGDSNGRGAFSTANGSGMGGSKPMITRKGVITRGGSTAQSPQVAATAGGRDDLDSIYRDTSRLSGDAPGATAAGEPGVVLNAAASNGAGMGGFLRKVGLKKISGYNVDDGANDSSTGAPLTAAGGASFTSQQAQEDSVRVGGQLAWQQGTRRVARMSRPSKDKIRPRNQVSLSEWLNTPSTKMTDPIETVPAPEGGKRGEGRKGKGSHAAAAEEHGADAATTAAAKNGKGKRGSKLKVKGPKSARKTIKQASAANHHKKKDTAASAATASKKKATKGKPAAAASVSKKAPKAAKTKASLVRHTPAKAKSAAATRKVKKAPASPVKKSEGRKGGKARK